MKSVKLFGEKILVFPHFKRVNRWFLILFSVLLPLIVVSTAYAAFSWGEVTGPVWQTPYYHFTIVVNTLNGLDHYVGLTYTVTHQTVPPTTDLPVCVICSAPGTGPFGCNIPASPGGTIINATVAWDISSFPNTQCNGRVTRGPAGSFTTGPTAVVVKSVTTEKVDALFSSIWSILLIAAMVVLMLLAVVWRYRIAKNKLATM